MADITAEARCHELIEIAQVCRQDRKTACDRVAELEKVVERAKRLLVVSEGVLYDMPPNGEQWRRRGTLDNAVGDLRFALAALDSKDQDAGLLAREKA